jgi:CheY-like chemotaxis protein
MRALVVEDHAARVAWLRGALVGAVVDVTASVPQAIEWLNTREYDAVFLDHDLLPHHYPAYVDAPHETGQGVANWLADHPEAQPTAIVYVHSMNTIAGPRMLSALLGRRVAWIPFAVLQSCFYNLRDVLARDAVHRGAV